MLLQQTITEIPDVLHDIWVGLPHRVVRKSLTDDPSSSTMFALVRGKCEVVYTRLGVHRVVCGPFLEILPCCVDVWKRCFSFLR